MIKVGYLKQEFLCLTAKSIKGLPPNVSFLKKLPNQTGGMVLEDPADAFRSHPFKSAEKKLIAQWLNSNSDDSIFSTLHYAVLDF